MSLQNFYSFFGSFRSVGFFRSKSVRKQKAFNNSKYRSRFFCMQIYIFPFFIHSSVFFLYSTIYDFFCFLHVLYLPINFGPPVVLVEIRWTDYLVENFLYFFSCHRVCIFSRDIFVFRTVLQIWCWREFRTNTKKIVVFEQIEIGHRICIVAIASAPLGLI
jgi:hypothetical protein